MQFKAAFSTWAAYLMETPETPKTEHMKNLLTRMRATKGKIDELSYAALVLERQGKISEATRKHRGAEFAKGVWKSLDSEYKRCWKRQRKKL